VITTLATVAVALAAIPALLFVINSRFYRRAPLPTGPPPAVSVLIPARNEERSIGPAVAAALECREIEFEILVLNDQSEDRTAEIVGAAAARDARVRLLGAPPLPEGWCGKQHACYVLAGHARYPLLAFVDADVCLAPDALARMAAFLDRSGADLVSGVPRQETGTLLERLVIPLIHVLLLGYLPIGWMRRSPHPAFAAGCGQLFVTRRSAYEFAGGHAAIRGSMHDGITLPRAYRRAGRRTDLCDATDLAACRMYHSAQELWAGLAKNACEGLAHPRRIIAWTGLLFGGQVLPFVLPAAAWWEPTALPLTCVAAALAWCPRLCAAVRFRQSWVGALLHPVGMTVLLAIQWYAAARALAGHPVGWKGRSHPARPVPAAAPVKGRRLTGAA
jgi:glycosyltransferase involved in cell wall biosynthesis